MNPRSFGTYVRTYRQTDSEHLTSLFYCGPLLLWLLCALVNISIVVHRTALCFATRILFIRRKGSPQLHEGILPTADYSTHRSPHITSPHTPSILNNHTRSPLQDVILDVWSMSEHGDRFHGIIPTLYDLPEPPMASNIDFSLRILNGRK